MTLINLLLQDLNSILLIRYSPVLITESSRNRLIVIPFPSLNTIWFSPETVDWLRVFSSEKFPFSSIFASNCLEDRIVQRRPGQTFDHFLLSATRTRSRDRTLIGKRYDIGKSVLRDSVILRSNYRQ